MNDKRPSRPERFALEVGLIALLPAIMLVITVATLATGDFMATGCGLGRIIHLNLAGQDGNGLLCTTLPLGADLPSITLGVTSEIAVVNYLLLTNRLRLLDVKLSTGDRRLFEADQLERDPMKKHNERIRKWLNVRIRWQLLLLVAVFALGTGFYFWVVQNNHLFKAMASIQGVAHPGGAVQDTFRASWWASWDQSPAMAIGWIVVGSVGTYFACCQAYLHYHLSKILRAAPKSMEFRHVPARLDRDHGWRPVGRIIAIAYTSTIAFICSVIALIYILRDPDADAFVRVVITLILVVVALGGTTMNILLVASLRVGVTKAFAAAVRVQSNKLNREIRELFGRGHLVEARLVALEAEHLAVEKTYPIQGTAVRALSLASGVIPVSKLLNDIFHLVF